TSIPQYLNTSIPQYLNTSPILNVPLKMQQRKTKAILYECFCKIAGFKKLYHFLSKVYHSLRKNSKKGKLQKRRFKYR
ncbi:MAG: hypothetical protein ACTTJF_01450, partial [Campylobacter sp.]|uniref:hypothetical protein n=1 Tax=Campylobacter sp. TaxID=205 RepID=UPI003FA13A68